MDWSNETYVRLYTRETDDDLVLSWTARAVWHEMLKKFDRSGLIDTRRGAHGLAALIRVPAEVVESAIAELVDDGRIRIVPTGYLAPNYMAAQEARKSDRLRQREFRERRHRDAKSQNVTSASRNVTERNEPSQDVTASHSESQPVTLCSADPDPLLSARARGVCDIPSRNVTATRRVQSSANPSVYFELDDDDNLVRTLEKHADGSFAEVAAEIRGGGAS